MLRVISANLNGIRSATSKGFFDWLASPGRRLHLHAGTQGAGADMTADMLQPGRLLGYFHYAEKKGY